MPSHVYRALRALRGLTRYKIPAHLTRRYRMLDDDAQQQLADRLHDFRQSTVGAPRIEDADFQNHLCRRLAENRYQVIPWLDAARSLDGAAVLEIGCGTGSATVALAEQGANVTAMDIDPEAIAVAELRCRLHGVEAEFVVANAAQLPAAIAGRQFDFVLFFASLEHMTHHERLAAMASTWKMLPSGSLWCVIETPNRLWYFDHHTAHLNFFMWLSDELAADYARFSPREDVRQLIERADDAVTVLRRAGRGVSFHEFDMALGPARDLKVVSSMPLFFRRHDPALRLRWRLSRDYDFERFLSRLCPGLHPGFLQPTLYLVIRKP